MKPSPIPSNPKELEPGQIFWLVKKDGPRALNGPYTCQGYDRETLTIHYTDTVRHTAAAAEVNLYFPLPDDPRAVRVYAVYDFRIFTVMARPREGGGYLIPDTDPICTAFDLSLCFQDKDAAITAAIERERAKADTHWQEATEALGRWAAKNLELQATMGEAAKDDPQLAAAWQRALHAFQAFAECEVAVTTLERHTRHSVPVAAQLKGFE